MMTNEISDIQRMVFVCSFGFFSILIVTYLLSTSGRLIRAGAINLNYPFWPATIISFFISMIFYGLGFETSDIYLTIANCLYIASAMLAVMVILNIAEKKSLTIAIFYSVCIAFCVIFYDQARRLGEVQLRLSIVSWALAGIYCLGFFMTMKIFWGKNVLPNLKFISITLFLSLVYWGVLGFVSLVAHLYTDWTSISEILFSKGMRIIAVSLNIFLFLLIGNYFFERVVELETKKSISSEKTMLDTLNALALARDNETGNHIIRTQKYVNKLALRLSGFKHYSETLNAQTISLLTKAASLHDIGKVGIPDSILLKTSKLTDEEWDVMKTHTTIGENVLTSVDVESHNKNNVLSFAIEIAGGHHEKWDGSGYPRGLKGSEIPLSARIMSLADMYDALLSERVYKESWSHDDAVREIQSKSGTHFDPEIVDAFVAEIEAFKEITIQYRDS